MMRVLVVAICGGLLFPAGAQAQTPDVLGELLKEVRALRIAMERAATVGARTQLLVARVQLQEQRITELSRRAVAVREELSKIDSGTTGIASMLERFESPTAEMPPEESAAFESQIEMFKTQMATAEKRRQELTNEEALLSQQISADQGRWSDINNQLDQLERSLMLPKQ